VSSRPSFLIIQTAFIGDVILATALIEKIHHYFPEASIDFLLRKGNEELLTNHPYVRSVLVWIKKKDKIKNLIGIIAQVRKNKYEYVINVHRFTSSGLITTFSGAKIKIGFDKNPMAFAFTKKVKHEIKEGIHEVDRNQRLIEFITDSKAARPKLFPSSTQVSYVEQFKKAPYVCIAPTSVWFTKQLPKQKWLELIKQLGEKKLIIFLLGAKADSSFCDALISESVYKQVINLAGKLSLIESAALMQAAVMNYVNDSAPMHLASGMNAPVTAIYCSTVPSFGFGPLSEISIIIETEEKLTCRPCGLHGYSACPQGHFKCATTIAF
jgi:heptosyltransferase-2